MTPAELLAELQRLGAVVASDDTGVARATGTGERPSTEVLAAVERYRWVLSWGLEGARSGHAWCACSGCGEPMLLPKPGRRCPVTLGCKGTMQLVPGPSFDHRAEAKRTDASGEVTTYTSHRVRGLAPWRPQTTANRCDGRHEPVQPKRTMEVG